MTKHTRRLIAAAAIPAALTLALAGCTSGGPTTGLTKDVIAGDWTCAAGTAVGGADTVDFSGTATIAANHTYEIKLGSDKSISITDKDSKGSAASGTWKVVPKENTSGDKSVLLQAQVSQGAPFQVQLPERLTSKTTPLDGELTHLLSTFGYPNSAPAAKVAASGKEIQFKLISDTDQPDQYLPVSCTR